MAGKPKKAKTTRIPLALRLYAGLLANTQRYKQDFACVAVCPNIVPGVFRPMTQGELAQQYGVHPRRVGQAMKLLREAGLLAAPGKVRVLKPLVPHWADWTDVCDQAMRREGCDRGSQ